MILVDRERHFGIHPRPTHHLRNQWPCTLDVWSYVRLRMDLIHHIACDRLQQGVAKKANISETVCPWWSCAPVWSCSTTTMNTATTTTVTTTTNWIACNKQTSSSNCTNIPHFFTHVCAFCLNMTSCRKRETCFLPLQLRLVFCGAAACRCR